MKLVRGTSGSRQENPRGGTPWLEDPVRARARRRLRLGGAASVAVLVLVPAHLLSVATALQLGERAWASGDPTAAERWFARADRIDVLERWRAPYDRGVAVFGQGRWLEAAELFARAQATVPEEHLCRVVLNRSLALETLGDELKERDDVAGARMRWNEAQDVLAEARGCSAEGEGGDGGEQDQESSSEETESGETGDGADADGDEGAEGEGAEGEGEDGEGSEGQQGEGGEGQNSEGQTSEGQNSEGQNSEGQGSDEGQEEGEKGKGDSAKGDALPGDGSGQEGAGSQQEQVEAASQRLKEKVSGQPSGAGGRQQEESPEQKQAELAERGAGAARDRSSVQDGAGPMIGSTPSRPTW